MKPTLFDKELDTLDLSFAQKQLIKQFVSEHIIGEFEPEGSFHSLYIRNKHREEQIFTLYGIKEEQ